MKTISLLITTTVLSFALISCSNRENATNHLKSTIDSLKVVNQQLSAATAEQSEESKNKKIVSDFYQELFGDKNGDAIDKFIGAVYIQHNPALPDGKEALKKAITVWFKDAPKETIDIQHIGAENDLVYIHTKSKRGAKTISIIDIFKLEAGKIVEHWDVIQEVPEKSANEHPMF